MPGIPITSLTNFPTLLNDTLFHVVDLNEAIPDDRNKSINWLQLQTLIGTNEVSIQATTQATGVAPVSTPADGTIIVDTNGTGTLFVRAGGAWRSVALV